MDRLPPDDLEHRIDRLLRDLPPHHAPASLEDRVLAALAARDARPWWRRSYTHWPAAVQGAFLAISAVLVALVIVASIAGLRGAGPWVSAPVDALFEQWTQLRSAGAVLAGLVGEWLPAVSSFWIYVGLGVGAVSYATLLGLGAAAYRLLWARR